jgi:hypothetical protein
MDQIDVVTANAAFEANNRFFASVLTHLTGERVSGETAGITADIIASGHLLEATGKDLKKRIEVAMALKPADALASVHAELTAVRSQLTIANKQVTELTASQANFERRVATDLAKHGIRAEAVKGVEVKTGAGSNLSFADQLREAKAARFGNR